MAAIDPNVPHHFDRRPGDHPCELKPPYGWRDDNGKPIWAINDSGTPICGRTTRGRPCKTTLVFPNGRCHLKTHGGQAPGRPPTTGRYSLVHNLALAEKTAQFLGDESPGDLKDELALMRGLLQAYLDKIAPGQESQKTKSAVVFNRIQSIAGVVERINRMLLDTALTQAELQVLNSRIAQALIKYVPDNATRIAFLREIGAGRPSGRFDPRALVDRSARAG